MPINLNVNNNNFAYPSDGDEPGWGNAATGWAEEVTTVLSGVQGSDDILPTSFNVANNIASPADVVGLIFNPTTVRSAEVSYSIYRRTDTNELAETGRMLVVYKNGGNTGEKWSVGQTILGDDSGVVFTMTDAGQIQYTSNDVTGSNYVGQIRFYAKSITQ